MLLKLKLKILLHFNSSVMERAAVNAARLDAHATACGSLYLVDAAVDLPFVRRIVEHFSAVRGCSAEWVRNRHVRPTNRVLEVRRRPKGREAHDVICAAVRAGERVVVCSSTKRFVLELQERAETRCPRARVVAHFSGSEGDEPLRDVDSRWSQADLLIYSPSVTAGVSFERAHFDRLFANFVCSRYTPGVEIALQQLFRARQLRGGSMTVWYSEFGIPRAVAGAAAPSASDPGFRGLHPHARGALDHRTPLGRLVAQGVLDMRHRSDTAYVRVLLDSLRHDHGIAARVIDVEATGHRRFSEYVDQTFVSRASPGWMGRA